METTSTSELVVHANVNRPEIAMVGLPASQNDNCGKVRWLPTLPPMLFKMQIWRRHL